MSLSVITVSDYVKTFKATGKLRGTVSFMYLNTKHFVVMFIQSDSLYNTRKDPLRRSAIMTSNMT